VAEPRHTLIKTASYEAVLMSVCRGSATSPAP